MGKKGGMTREVFIGVVNLWSVRDGFYCTLKVQGVISVTHTQTVPHFNPGGGDASVSSHL